MRMTVFEGTLEEIKELHKELSADRDIHVLAVTSDANGSSGTPGIGEHSWAGTDVAYRALTRIRLSKEQRTIVVAMYNAHPDWTLATTLQKKIGYTASQFAGLMGAFGRRFTHTEGYREGSWFFDQEWDDDHSCVRYRLPDSVRKAVEKAGLA